MIVTIDGPAGAGKSSVARALAERLGFEFLDTGAMYRAVAWAAIHAGVDIEDAAAVAKVAKCIKIEFQGDTLFVDGRDVSQEIRSPQVTENVRFAAGNEDVRSLLVEQQRRIGLKAKNLVTEGRDQGTIVFPDAECKIFLTATAEERARRRYRQLISKGVEVTFADVLDSQNRRDEGDQSRDVAPLAKAPDAIEVYSDNMSLEQVLTHLQWLVEANSTA